jgi:hypothetical protein
MRAHGTSEDATDLNRPIDVLVACVAENEDSWYTKVQNLALSLRRFGGRLGDAPIVASFVDGASPGLERRLEGLDVEVRSVPRSDFGPPATNKLAMLNLYESHDFDLLLAVDCDIVVTGDISDWLEPDRLRATPEHVSPLRLDQWESLYGALGVAVPSRRLRMVHDGRTGFPYYSSGVLSIPSSFCAQLHRIWRRHCERFIELSAASEFVPTNSAFIDQVALSTAVEALAIPVEPLPASLNLCTTVPVHRSLADQIQPPFVLHYRNEIDASGFLYVSRFRAANPFLDAFNRARADAFGLEYNGLRRAPWPRRLARWLGYIPAYSWRPILALRRTSVARVIRSYIARSARGG